MTSVPKRFSMTHTPPASAGGSEFDNFLYAYIGEENNGMLLSVLSALARRNVDPWGEASRLARLPRATAVQLLTALIAALPEGSSARSNPEMHAERLTALLPQSAATVSQSRPASIPGARISQQGRIRYALFCLLLMTVFLAAQWLMEHSR